MTIEAVLFDVDDTLIDHTGAVRNGFHAFLAREVPDADVDASYVRWRELEDVHYDRYLAGELTWQGQRRARVRDIAPHLGLDFDDDDAVDAWFDAFRVEMEAATQAFGDAVDALMSLGLPCGVISNNETANVRAKLARCGLGEHFPVVLCPSERGLPPKPNPAIFRSGCDAMGTDPAATAYIGDLLQTDAVGACDAGLVGVWLDRHDSPVELPAGIRRVISLVDFVARIEAGTI